ncbi:MAG TPA: tetratricopeptide repeat protein [Phenylobacterium sp.]|nr:tetratricopeptide repeat protein [Phenylobacterium sp.]
MVDVFEEVEEQLRSDRYKALALKFLPWVAGALVLALAVSVGVWVYENSRTKAAAKASEEYAQAMEALDQGRTAEAQTLWTEVSNSPSKAYKSLALQHLGGIRLAANDVPGAVKLFDEAAAASPDPMLADVASLKSAFALLDTAPLKDIQARLEPLMKEGRPYRTEAREALAFAKLMAGDTAGARGDFVVVSLLPDAQQGARDRARAAMALIDSGSAKMVPAVAKAAMALPPPIPLAPGAAIPGLTAPQQQDPIAQ